MLNLSTYDPPQGWEVAGPNRRYALGRRWAYQPTAESTLVWLMLNPSTADGEADDPTIRRLISFSKREGFTSLLVVNLFSLRSPKPKTLLTHAAPNDARNDDSVRVACQLFGPVVCAWGAAQSQPVVAERAAYVLERLVPEGTDLRCLGLTSGGYPRHPLYVKADEPMLRFDPYQGVFPL